RLAAPVFFFFLGFAETRTAPLRWVGLGVLLTVLESWNADWDWVAPNILLSFYFIRLVRPYVKEFLRRYGWPAFAAVLAGLVAAAPFTGGIVDYGAEGWLWALFGFFQRVHVDGAERKSGSQAFGAMRVLACFAAVAVYIWREQVEYGFAGAGFVGFVAGISALAFVLFHFRRGPSRIQPPELIAGVLHFTGRHTLEIYALQLAGFELIVKLWPELAA
ncbi:MAG: hypothetical protein ACR2OR_15920, partial [Hyphomicrobiales bacterium]